MNIKESKELLTGIELVAVTGAKIAKNGIDLSDLTYVLGLIEEFEVLKAAYEGIDQVDDELKELDEKELIELGLQAFSMIKNIKVNL